MTTIDPLTLKRLADIIHKATRFNDCLIWVGDYPHPISDSDRERIAKRYSIPMICWIENDDVFTAKYVMDIRQGCWINARGDYTRNGEKTTLAEIQNSYQRILEAVPELNDSPEDS